VTRSAFCSPKGKKAIQKNEVDLLAAMNMLMIPRDEEFDVFVSEGALVEVWRGERLSVAQQFGKDWDGPVHSVVHAAVFCPPPGAPAAEVRMPMAPTWGGRRCAALARGGSRMVVTDARARRVI
jgi:hypothetical protein